MTFPSPRRWIAVLLAAGLTGFPAGCGGKGEITVFTANEMAGAAIEAASEFRGLGGGRVALRTGTTADLARAIEGGQAADLWLSAEPDWTDSLEARGRLAPGGARLLAWDTLVAAVPAGRGPAPGNQYLLPDYRRVAMADTASSLAGRCAKQGLTAMGVWNAIRHRVVVAPDARSALALVERAEADVGILPATLAEGSPGVEVGFTLSEGTHEVLACTGAVVEGARHAEAARRFLDFLSGPRGREILRKHGFKGVGE